VYFPRQDIVMLPFGHLSASLIEHLEALSIPLERGMAIVATRAPHDVAVLDVLRASGGGATVEYNRGAVMVLPAGATKGTGLLYALRELGYSPRNVVACGDAENDRSLFDVAEVAVAVANAAPDIQALADVVLSEAGGAGVRTLIADLIAGQIPARRSRPERRLCLGRRLDGTPVYLDPFMLLDDNLGIAGSSGAGKSWLAGLLAEELLKQGYQICLIDPEGDYRGLRAFPHTLLLGGADTRLPTVEDVVTLSEYAEVSLVLDFSSHPLAERRTYINQLL
jgi:haloacid dehalogenase-like hydrolase/Helicase HerA, central domain